MAIKIDIPGFGEVSVEGAAQEDTMQAILAAVSKSDKSKGAEEKKLKKANEDAAKAAGKVATEFELLEEAAKKAEKETKVRSDKRDKDLKQAWKSTTDQLGGFGVALAATAASVATSMIKNIDANAENPIALGAGLLNTGLEMLGAGLKIGVDVVSSFTGALAGAIPVIGGGAQRLNDGLANVAKEVIDFGIAVAKAANDFMAAEFEKTVASMKAMTGAGASFAGGMTELRQVANESGVGLTVFTKVVQNSQNYLHTFGITATESTALVSLGMKTLANTTRTVNGVQMKARDQLLNLGYSYEEQGEIMAQYMVSQKQAGKNLKDMTPKELTDGVLQYAKNLKVISDITGQDAKKLMEKAQAETMRGAMIGKLDANQAQAYKESYAVLTKLGPEMGAKAQIALTQAMSGNPITDPIINGNKYILEMIKKTASDAMTGQANMGAKTFDNMLAAGNQIKQFGERATDTAALLGVTDPIVKGFADLNNAALMLTPSMANAGTISEAAADAQSKTIDKVSQDFATASDQVAKFGIAMEKIATDNMSAYADMIVKAIGVAQEAIAIGIEFAKDPAKAATKYGKKALDVVTPEKEMSTGRKVLDWGGTAIGALAGGLIAAPTVAGIGIGAAAGGVAGQAAGSWAADKLGYAKGGIASGPLSGYQEMLHGTEAVVPLPDGKSIPVTLDSSSLNASIQQQTVILNGILSAMNKNNQLSSGILQNSY
jgi:hypothetical protein